MSQRLEDFLKKRKLPIEFRKITKMTHAFDGRKNTCREESEWTCVLPSVYMGQTVSIEHCHGAVNFYVSSGKTRKEAREKLVKFVRGKTLAYGRYTVYRVKVPKNIR